MGQTNYIINEYGEVIREDYFFSLVKGTTPQVLPTNRKVWKIWLLSFLTLGIYGMVVMILYVAQIIWGIFVMSRYVKQHNTVNKIYNLNTFGQKS